MKRSLLMITPENGEIHAFRKRQFNNFIQLTMPYLAGFVDEARFDILLVDEYNQKIPYNRGFDLVAITVNTPNAAHCYEMAEKFRTRGSWVVFGGPHATLLPDEAKTHCDTVLIGEGELIWPQFLDDFCLGKAKAQYQCEETPVLSGLPLPRRDLIRGRHFTKGAVFATRGCPYNCHYCNLKQIYCEDFRKRPVSEVITDIKAIRGRYFVFWDDNFFGDAQHVKELLQELKKVKKRWAAQVSVDKCRDAELLRLAKEAGCVYLFLGLESFAQKGLSSVNKEFNAVHHYEEIIGLIHKSGISVQAGIIFGLDSDDQDTFARTLEYCEKFGIDGVTASILTPFPKTLLYEQMKEKGQLTGKDWSSFNGKTRVVFKPAQMTPEELFQGYMWFRKEFYSYRSISRRLRVSKTNVLYNFVTSLGYKWSM